MTFLTLMVVVFVIGYLLITLEHTVNINKTASALLTGVLCWIIYIVAEHHQYKVVNGHLAHHLSEISQILFFLLGAMTIVELVDAHEGFRIITDQIRTKSAVTLLWVLAFITFFLSSALDNLTTAIVMVSLLRKLVKNIELRQLYAGIVIIAANAGGAWSPIGDVTTTMLWIGEQISAVKVMYVLILPSLVSVIIPVIWLSFSMKGNLEDTGTPTKMENPRNSMIMLIVGLGALLFVPVLKVLTHLPPYMGILFGLGVIWVVSEVLNSEKDQEIGHHKSVNHALSRIDSSSILFFLGILVAIGSLQSTGLLHALAEWMNKTIGNQNLIIVTIGLASAVIDNVPLVAAVQGMYELTKYPTDHSLWIFLAYCAGTGGSLLIIGSAAGVAVMGMEKISFFWYVKRITLPATLGYFGGVAVYTVLEMLKVF